MRLLNRATKGNEMNLKTQRKTAEQLAPLFPGGLAKLPTLHFDTMAGLGRDVDGMFYGNTFAIGLRRRPTSCDWKFLLAHEMAHAWQYLNKLPFCEDQADALAASVVGYWQFDSPCNKINPATATHSPVTQFASVA